MALTKTNPAAPATEAAAAVKPVGTFEAMDETTTSTAAANETVAEPAATPAAAPAAVAVRPASAVAVVAAPGNSMSAFVQQLDSMKGSLSFNFGDWDVFKGISGNIKGTGDNKASLGRWAKVSMISWADRTQISPGSDSADSKDYVAYSKDHITIDHVIGAENAMWIGRKADDYVEYLKTNGYPKANKSMFVDIGCVLHEGESKEAKEMVGDRICLSLSKSSIPSFSKYQGDLASMAICIKRGGALANLVKVPEDPFTFFVAAEPASKPGMEWTKIRVTTKMPVF